MSATLCVASRPLLPRPRARWRSLAEGPALTALALLLHPSLLSRPPHLPPPHARLDLAAALSSSPPPPPSPRPLLSLAPRVRPHQEREKLKALQKSIEASKAHLAELEKSHGELEASIGKKN